MLDMSRRLRTLKGADTYETLPYTSKALISASFVTSGAKSPTKTWKWSVKNNKEKCKWLFINGKK